MSDFSNINIDFPDVEIITMGETCPQCEGSNTDFRPSLGFWKCHDCNHTWGDDYEDLDDRFDEDEDDSEEVTSYDLGACCSCQRDNNCRNILSLHFRTPYGFGWGCFACGLPMEGAIAVLCDECIENNVEPTEFVKGEALAKQRAPIAELTEPFEHDPDFHPEMQETV